MYEQQQQLEQWPITSNSTYIIIAYVCFACLDACVCSRDAVSSSVLLPMQDYTWMASTSIQGNGRMTKCMALASSHMQAGHAMMDTGRIASIRAQAPSHGLTDASMRYVSRVNSVGGSLPVHKECTGSDQVSMLCVAHGIAQGCMTADPAVTAFSVGDARALFCFLKAL